MTIKDKQIQLAINEFRDRLILKDAHKIDAIIVYGSLISGKYNHKDSDIDIGVLALDKSIDEDILDIETAVSLKYSVVISALLMTKKELDKAMSAGYLFPKEILGGRIIYESGKRRSKISS